MKRGMTLDEKYDWHNANKIKIGQKLLYENEVVEFDGYDECYGRIDIRFSEPLYIRPAMASYGGREVPIYTKTVSIEECEIYGKILK